MKSTERFEDIEALFEDEAENYPYDLSPMKEPISILEEERLSRDEAVSNLSNNDELLSENEMFPELEEEDILEARKASRLKLVSTLESICERYNQAFEDGDEIDMMSLQVIVDKGYLRHTSHSSVFGRGIDSQLMDMIEKRKVPLYNARCKRCRIHMEMTAIYCPACKQELQERRSLMLSGYSSSSIPSSPSSHDYSSLTWLSSSGKCIHKSIL
jgi:hypothetical protein